MLTDPAVTAIVAFLVVFAGMAAAGFLLSRGRRGGKASLRLRQLAAAPSPSDRAARGGSVFRPLLDRLARAGAFGTVRMAGLRTQCLQAGFFSSLQRRQAGRTPR